MDCKSPMLILADMSVRKQAEARQKLPSEPVPPLNFDINDIESPNPPSRKQSSRTVESPFLGISSRYPENYPSASPQLGSFVNMMSSPALSPGDVHHAREESPSSGTGSTSPVITKSKQQQLDKLADLKKSPRIDVLMQAAESADIQKKKRQPPNPEKKSQYRGVSWQKTSRAWVAQYKSNGKTTYLGLFATEDDAARAYDVAVYTNSLGTNQTPRLNFGKPDQEIVDAYVKNGNVPPGRLGATAASKREERLEDDDGRDKHTSSNYRGVSWYAARQIWKASIQVNRKKEYIGRFEYEEDAARAYNKRAIELRGKDAILNQVPEKMKTRYPPGEKPLSPEELARNIAEEKEKKKLAATKRKSQSSTASDSSAENSSSANAKKVKRLKPTNFVDSAVRSSTFLPSFGLPATPDLSMDTPMLMRMGLPTTGGRKRLAPVSKPSFTNVDDEINGVLRNGGVEDMFNSPLFASPAPSTTKRSNGRHMLNTAPMTGVTLGATGNLGFTPMFAGLFDSPFPLDTKSAFTPGEYPQYRLDIPTGNKARRPK